MGSIHQHHHHVSWLWAAFINIITRWLQVGLININTISMLTLLTLFAGFPRYTVICLQDSQGTLLSVCRIPQALVYFGAMKYSDALMELLKKGESWRFRCWCVRTCAFALIWAHVYEGKLPPPPLLKLHGVCRNHWLYWNCTVLVDAQIVLKFYCVCRLSDYIEVAYCLKIPILYWSCTELVDTLVVLKVHRVGRYCDYKNYIELALCLQTLWLYWTYTVCTHVVVLKLHCVCRHHDVLKLHCVCRHPGCIKVALCLKTPWLYWTCRVCRHPGYIEVALCWQTVRHLHCIEVALCLQTLSLYWSCTVFADTILVMKLYCVCRHHTCIEVVLCLQTPWCRRVTGWRWRSEVSASGPQRSVADFSPGNIYFS